MNLEAAGWLRPVRARNERPDRDRREQEGHHAQEHERHLEHHVARGPELLGREPVQHLAHQERDAAGEDQEHGVDRGEEGDDPVLAVVGVAGLVGLAGLFVVYARFLCTDGVLPHPLLPVDATVTLQFLLGSAQVRSRIHLLFALLGLLGKGLLPRFQFPAKLGGGQIDRKRETGVITDRKSVV